jgi:hypothetical protein
MTAPGAGSNTESARRAARDEERHERHAAASRVFVGRDDAQDRNREVEGSDRSWIALAEPPASALLSRHPMSSGQATQWRRR